MVDHMVYSPRWHSGWSGWMYSPAHDYWHLFIFLFFILTAADVWDQALLSEVRKQFDKQKWFFNLNIVFLKKELVP